MHHVPHVPQVPPGSSIFHTNCEFTGGYFERILVRNWPKQLHWLAIVGLAVARRRKLTDWLKGTSEFIGNHGVFPSNTGVSVVSCSLNQFHQSDKIWVMGNFGCDISWDPFSRLKDSKNHHFYIADSCFHLFWDDEHWWSEHDFNILLAWTYGAQFFSIEPMGWEHFHSSLGGFSSHPRAPRRTESLAQTVSACHNSVYPALRHQSAHRCGKHHLSVDGPAKSGDHPLIGGQHPMI